MEPPPQTGPTGTYGPPRMGTTTNAYWRKRGHTPTSMATAPVQPVTNPFAFGRMTPQNRPQGAATTGNAFVMPSPSPSLFTQPVPVDPSAFGDYSHGGQTSLPGQASMPGPGQASMPGPGQASLPGQASRPGQAPLPGPWHSDIPAPGQPGSLQARFVPPPVSKGGMYANVSASAGDPFTNNTVMSSTQPGLGQPPAQSFHNMVSGVENAFLPVHGRSQSRQGVPTDLNTCSTSSASLSSFVHTPPQQVTGSWGSVHGAPPTSVQNFPPPTQNPAYNAPYCSPPYLEVSNLPPQANLLPNEPTHQPVQQRTGPTHYPVSSGANNVFHQSSSQFNSAFPTDYTHSQVPERSSWFNQSYKEQQQHPPLPNPNNVQSGAQSSTTESKPQVDCGKTPGPIATDSDSGTISMFFKGDEAENVEIISAEMSHVSNKPPYDPSHYQNIGHQGVPSSQPQPTAAVMPSQTIGALNSSPPNAQLFVSQNTSSFHDSQASWKPVYALADSTSPEAVVGSEPQYDNVENIECIQNQEVLPNEPQNISLFPPSVNSDTLRYGPVPGSSLPKNVPTHTEGGPNLETPDSSTHPVRSDSVSSSYSNLSHRSLPVSTRPQEHMGTFIQKESGKLETDPSNSFFKQVDSSPMVLDAGAHSMGQNTLHGNLSQPPTPSPPKPTGIFQTSANSSFEPVRSHSVGVKPVDTEQSKVVGEVREGHKSAPGSSHFAAVPASSPGNLEQPPDNLESIFLDKINAQGSVANIGNLYQSAGDPSFDNISLLLEKRPSSRAHGSNKKCESPATTLWAQGELSNFGGNVLLAPAAPALYVPTKPQTEIIQPPEDGSLDPQPSSRSELDKLQASPEEHIISENLENPPKIGDEEPLHSQASSGYASLLSSPPTESLQNQPVLIAQPNKSYNLAQPINFSLSLPNQIRNINATKDLASGNHAVPRGNFISDENTSLSLNQTRPVLNAPESSHLSSNTSAPNSDHFSASLSNPPSNMLRQSSASQAPLNLVTESQKTVKVESSHSDSVNKSTVPVSAPTGTNLPVGNGNAMVAPPLSYNNSAGTRTNSRVETVGALDFTVPRAPANHSASSGIPAPNHPITGGPVFPAQSVIPQNVQQGPDINKQGFYQQVTKDVQQQPPVHNTQQVSVTSPEYMVPVSQPTSSISSAQVAPVGKPITYSQQIDNQRQSAEPPYTSASDPVPLQPAYPPTTANSTAVNLNHTTAYPEQPRPPASQTPQQADPYYYYRTYGTYPPAYQQPYPPMDPRAPQLYYPDPYGTYDHAYRQYGNSGYVNAGKYPYQDPERPSSRSSHCSDRPSSRQGYNGKGDWSSQSNYYDYYSSHYDYGDPARWDRYPGAYDHGYRDPRSNYYNYMYNNREDMCQKVPYAYTSRYNVYEDRWQYDPRYDGGFDDENEPRRDLAKDDFDRRSVHSEQSVHSMHSRRSAHSRRSSFSSHSQHSQIYKSQQDLTATSYDTQIPNAALNEYSYGMYPTDYSNQHSLDTYPYGYQDNAEWQPVEQVPARSLTPEKFGSPHVCARFGPGGHLIKVLPNLPSDGQPTLVEIHNMEIIFQNSPEQEQMRTFPGPLVKEETHKVDVINFAQNKSKECSQNESLLDQESACLLWDFIVLLCRQNGTVVGTDIAELLLQDHKTVWLPGKSPNEANLIDFSNEPLEQEEESGASQLSFLTDTLPGAGTCLEKETERFRELLLFGRKKDALESAMKHGLWGHALLLASKMDSRTHARVMTRFANSLPINDPLQTVYQLLSGRMPAAATCCGDEKWGDWRPHLAMVLSNLTSLDVPTRTITTMGDTLASRGLLDAAHFCYLMAQVGFGVYTKKTTKLVLIGSNHSLPFAKFASNEAIQRTEAYEYAQSLGTQTITLPNIQVFKFIYACRLAEHGLCAQAFHYCEVIARTLLKHPSYYSPVLVSQLLEVSSHLRFFDPQLKEKPEQELFIEPPWLQQLRHLDMQMKQGSVVYNTGRTTPQQYACSTPSSEHDQTDGMGAARDLPANTDNPLLANLLPNMMPPVQGVQLALPGPEPAPPIYQPQAVKEPSYPSTPQSPIPAPAFPPPVSAPGFVPYGSEQTPTYPAAGVGPLTPPPPPTDFAPQEPFNQDPGMRRMSQSSPTKTTFHDSGFDFYGEMAKMAPGQRSRTVSQSSSHMRRIRTTSESSTHSVGSVRRSSVSMQPSPPPPSIPEADQQEAKKEPKSHPSAHGSGRSWFPLKIGWLMGKGKNEAHLPDDRNKSIVWDEKKQKWINLDEPEGEESKPLPPPPSGIPKKTQNVPPGPGGPPNPNVNMFSIRAGGARARYVDVLNPGSSRPSNTVLPPADLFAPLAPMPIPTNLFVPNAVPEEQQPVEASAAETVQPADQKTGFDNPAQTQFLNSASLPPGADLPASNQEESQTGELSRSSSLSSLSREVSQHFNQNSSNVAATSGPPPPAGAVQFYNPSQFAQQQPSTGGTRPGRFGQRKYPSLK
ncbi:protein transport protein Sec16A [Rhinophrynus dorsalis]